MINHLLYIALFSLFFLNSLYGKSKNEKTPTKTIYLILDSINGDVWLLDSVGPYWNPVKELPQHSTYRIKTGDSGYIRLAFPDGSFFSLGPKSQINVSNSKMDEEKRFSQSINLLRGEAFLLREKKESKGKFMLGPICFPMGCVDTEYGSYILEAKYTGDRTDVLVLRGYAKIFQTKKKVLHDTKEEYFISLKKNGLVEGPLLFDDEMLMEIYPWIDNKIIADEIYEGRLARRFKKELLNGANMSNVLFIDFEQIGRKKKEWDVSEFVSRFLYRSLKNQQGVNVFRSNPQHISSLNLGKRLLADKVVEGKITHFELTRSARYLKEENKYELVPKALIKVSLKIWDVMNSSIVFEKKITMEKYGQPDQVEMMQQVIDGPLEIENQSVQKSPIWGAMRVLSQNVEDIILSL